MPKYKCENQECEMFGVEEVVNGGRITIVNGEAVTTGQACPNCGVKRTVIREGGFTTYISGTNDQKNRMLR